MALSVRGDPNVHDSMITVIEDATLQDVVNALEANQVDVVGVTDPRGTLVGTIQVADLVGVVEPDGVSCHANGGPGLRRRRTARAQATAAELMAPAALSRRIGRRHGAPPVGATAEGAVR